MICLDASMQIEVTKNKSAGMVTLGHTNAIMISCHTATHSSQYHVVHSSTFHFCSVMNFVDHEENGSI